MVKKLFATLLCLAAINGNVATTLAGTFSDVAMDEKRLNRGLKLIRTSLGVKTTNEAIQSVLHQPHPAPAKLHVQNLVQLMLKSKHSLCC